MAWDFVSHCWARKTHASLHKCADMPESLLLVYTKDGFRPKKKIGVFTVCLPTLFYSCRPYHFFSETKKKETVVRSCLSGPGFKYWYSNFSLILFYSVCSQTFYGYLRILSIQDGDVLIAFRFKKMWSACLKQQVITRWLEMFNVNHPCDDVFLLWVYFPLLLLDVVSIK